MSTIAVLGAGHNGLICACYLAKAGHRVVVYEQAPLPGGCTTTEEMYPGFRYNIGAIELEGVVNSGVIKELSLEQFGLEMIHTPHLLSVWVGADTLHLGRDQKQVVAALSKRFGEETGKQWEAFCRYSASIMSMLGTFQHVNAPDAGGLSDVMGNIGRLGEGNERILQSLLAPSQVVIDEWVDEPMLRGACLAYATHPQLPPWLPGTGPLACLLPSSHGGAGARPRGGTGKLIDALVACLQHHGGELRCAAPVTAIRQSGNKLREIEIAGNETVPVDALVSTIDILRLQQLLSQNELPTAWQRGVRRAHCGLYNVGEIKLDIALSSPPAFINDDPASAGALKYLMAAADSYSQTFKAIIGGHFPGQPPMMVGVPSIDDPTMAPEGKAVLWLSSFVPAKIAGGRTWPEENEAAADRLLTAFEAYAPGTREKILHMTVTGPAEWEQRTGNPAGNPNHLDMTIDQCFSFRPAVGMDRYRSPIDGLYLSGAGTHPGGGVHGMPGKMAAAAILGGEARQRTSRPSLIQLAKAYFQLRRSLR